MPFHNPTAGLEVICGPMFSGKSEELIRRLRRARIARQRVQVFKPRIDDRYAADRIVSHSEQSLEALVVRDVEDIRKRLDDRTEVIGIDEVQFFDRTIVDLCERQANMGRRVIVAGLDLDYRGVPFDPVPQLMAIAEYVTKTLAVCHRCGAPASRTQRIVASEERIVVGALDAYEARCRRCFEPDLPSQLAMDLAGERE
ncbi:MAG TPA: thymidine kinase [Myxococcota bacterium]|jgi:thymidine kinase|nr:thymidine kinase [Myxococcota bacterium]